MLKRQLIGETKSICEQVYKFKDSTTKELFIQKIENKVSKHLHKKENQSIVENDLYLNYNIM